MAKKITYTFTIDEVGYMIALLAYLVNEYDDFIEDDPINSPFVAVMAKCKAFYDSPDFTHYELV